MGGWAILGICVAFAFFASPAFAQEPVNTSNQTTLSGDLANNPIAQDILKKIEQTKKWIQDLEQKD